MICFQLKDENTLVFTLKNLLKNPVFDPYKKVGVRKYEISVSQLQEVVSICDRKMGSGSVSNRDTNGIGLKVKNHSTKGSKRLQYGS